MKFAILTASNSRNAGGLCGAIAGLTREANLHSSTIELFSYDDNFSTEDWWQYGNTVNHSYHKTSKPVFSTFGYSPNLLSLLEKEHPQLIDVQGLWMYHSWAALKYQKKHLGIKKVITTHGMLDSWALKNSAWKKKIVGSLFEYENLKTADCFHALCYSEFENIRQFGLKNPVAIIPNGIDLPVNPPYNRNKKDKILLYISRIHPKKGIKELIEGVALLQKQRNSVLKSWKIRIAGWDQQHHQEELQSLAKKLKVNDTIHFIGPIFGKEKEKELCQADAFILPSFSEGLPMSILEAWAYQLPCLMTNFCNLPEGFEVDAAIQIEPHAESIAEGVKRIIQMTDDERINMGKRGYELCKLRFTWKAVAEMKLQMYNWLIGKEKRPNFVLIK